MRKLFLQMMMTLDGRVEAPDGAFDWHAAGEELDQYVAEMLGSIDGILVGRKTYEGFASYWPTSTRPEAPRMNELPKLVFSRTLSRVEWQNARLVTGDVAQEVARLKQQPGEDLALFGSNTLAATFARLGLIDEFRFIVSPIVMGEGTPLLRDIGSRVRLKLARTATFRSGIVSLYYRPA